MILLRVFFVVLLPLAIFGFSAYLAWTALDFPPLPWIFLSVGTAVALAVSSLCVYITDPGGDPKRFGEP